MSKVVLITGGGTGIGAATARIMRSQGWQVVVCGRRREPMEALAQDCGASLIVADLVEPGANAQVVDQVVHEHGRLDGLVLNAGIQRLGTFETLTEQDWDAIIATNLTAPFLMIKAALPQLLEHQGAVVTVSSVAGLRASNNMAAYGPSKAGVLALGQQLAVDFSPRGIRSNVVCPGWTRSELADEEMAHLAQSRGTDLDESYDFVTSFVPLRRAARAEEVGQVIAFLMSDAASYVNAAVVTVDGGHVALDPGTVPFDPRVTVT